MAAPYHDTFNNCGDSQFADNVYQYADSVSWLHGKHMFKFGGEARFLQFNVRRLTTSSGEFDFDAAETSLGGVGGDPIASALFGIVHQGVLNYGSTSGVRYKDYAMYAQDNYRMTPKLTVNYGLRYDLDIPATEAQNRFSMVDPTLPNPGRRRYPGRLHLLRQRSGTQRSDPSARHLYQIFRSRALGSLTASMRRP